jgi:tetratricopeptide (TPR) repeat protein
VGVDRHRVTELYAAGPDGEGSGSGYRLGQRLVLTARHVIMPAMGPTGGQLLVRPVEVPEWLPAEPIWDDEDADAALVLIRDERWRPAAAEAVLRWGELPGADPLSCAAVGFPWASTRPDRVRDTAHLYGHIAPLGQLKAGRLDLDVASASPTARPAGSPWAGMSGAAVVADSHLVGVVTVDPARYQDRLVAVPASQLLNNPEFRRRLADHGVPTEAAPVGAGWYLRLAGEQAVSLGAPYQPISRRFGLDLPALLDPAHGLVPYLGRQPQLDQITAWCRDPAGMPLMLLRGGGGSGKTRLGREACVRMLVSGWDAGLADDRRNGAATGRLERPTLLVVDDADLRTPLIGGLVDYLRRDDAGPPVRLLLISRAAGVWWDRLVRQLQLSRSVAQLDLDQHPIIPADRADHFHQAAAAFAPYDAEPVGRPLPADLAGPAFTEPLLIHIAALLGTAAAAAATPATSGSVESATADRRTMLLRTLCERERSRWEQLGGPLNLNPDLPLGDQVVSLATLTAAEDQPTAVSLLAAVPNQREVDRVGTEGLAVWAHRLYAGPAYWNPVRPDLLAGQHLADTPQLDHLATHVVHLADGAQGGPEGGERGTGLVRQLLSELTRAAPNQPTIRATLDRLLAGALPRLVQLAIDDRGGGLADLTSLALEQAPQPDLAISLADELPERSVPLAALAATLTSQQVSAYRAAAGDRQPVTRNELAGRLNNLSLRLAELGRREDALAAIAEAVEVRRELAAARPAAFRPDLASVLNNLSLRLADLGRPEDALAAIGEAVEVYRELAAARPAAFRPDLATSLNNLSLRLADLGRREDALAAIGEAVEVRRELATARPAAFRPDLLAGSLNNLSLRLAELGRPEDALAAIGEAVEVYRELAAARPATFRPDLATSLNNLSNALADLGRPEDALAAIGEAVEAYRELAAARPATFRPDLATSLNNLSNRLADLGRPEDALAAIGEAVDIRRELAAARPAAFRPDLAGSLNNLSVRLADLGRREDALAAIREAVEAYRELAAARPAAFRPDLASVLNNLSLRLADLGRREDALAAIDEAVEVYRELAAARPTAFRPDLAGALIALGVRLTQLERFGEALTADREAVLLYAVLNHSDPERFGQPLRGAQDNLAIDLRDLGWSEERIRQELAQVLAAASEWPP